MNTPEQITHNQNSEEQPIDEPLLPWQREKIVKVLEEAKRGDTAPVPNEVVMRWLESWGTKNELPFPLAD
ncbi:hypothetical protein ACQZV8_15620 [Magnetococcales bacterium HHB-1]